MLAIAVRMHANPYINKSERSSLKASCKKKMAHAAAMTNTMSAPAGNAPSSPVQPIQMAATLTAARMCTARTTEKRYSI